MSRIFPPGASSGRRPAAPEDAENGSSPPLSCLHDGMRIAGSARLFETVPAELNTWVYALDCESLEFLFINARMRKDFGEDVLGKKCWEVFRKRDVPCGECPGRWKEFREGESYSFELYDPGTENRILRHGSLIRWIDGRSVYLENAVDITGTKKNERSIEYTAWHDALLDLPNRHKCWNDLQLLLEKGAQGTLLLLGLDDFKVINDALGHSYGDLQLKAVADYFRSSPEFSGKTYRFGGDEFVVILHDMEDGEADAPAEKLLARFRRPWHFWGAHVSFCTASIGLVRFPEDGDTARELLRNADMALYAAKNQGRNCIGRFTNVQNEEIVRRLEKGQRLHLSVLRGCRDFKTRYQPIVDVRTKRWVGAEALVRWDDAGMGLVSPMDFIPLSEYLGLVTPIGEHVLRAACRQCKLWLDMGIPDFLIHVNLSLRQLVIPDFIALVEEVLRESALPPQHLILEVTESLAMKDSSQVFAKLADLRGMGVKIAMDDFGTGYSSLGTLRSIPLDILKIDKTFIKDITATRYNRVFLRTIVELAQSLNLSVCSEGVETDEQFEIVSDFGCHAAQGFLFAAPLHAGELNDRLAEQYRLSRDGQ